MTAPIDTEPGTHNLIDPERLRILMEDIIDGYIQEMTRTKADPPRILLAAFNAIDPVYTEIVWTPEKALTITLTLAIIYESDGASARCIGIADALALSLSDEQIHNVQIAIDIWRSEPGTQNTFKRA